MALVVTFTGKTSLPGPDTGYRVWSYKIDSGPGDLQPNQRIALGLPAGVDVQSPDSYPGVPLLAGTFLQRDAGASRQYVGRVIAGTGAQVISFVAPTADSTCEMLLVKAPQGQSWTSVPFATAPGGPAANVQVLAGPLPGPPVFNGRPVTDFAGTFPYASEVFGVYQPLIGWFGAQSTLRAAGDGLSRETLAGEAARTLDDPALAALAERFSAGAQAILSPVGLVSLFREYFFEFDTFLGPPAGHLWISPGGTVEVVETSTRRTLVEKTAEQSEESSRKTEESLTQQDDVADAVKDENANDTKLGVSATGGVNAGIYHGEASTSFSTDSTVKKSSEETHKRSRTQSAKVTSEIKRNFKTTFKTVTETTDTSSRRYVVQNTTNQLVNYELRRKMRKVGVQLQHIGTRLSWQVYLPTPGRDLGLGDMVNVVAAPDLTAIKKPEAPPPLLPRETTVVGTFPAKQYPGTVNSPHLGDDYTLSPANPNEMDGHDNEDHIVSTFDYVGTPPGPGYTLSGVHLESARTPSGEAKFAATYPILNSTQGTFQAHAEFLNFGGNPAITLTFQLLWQPPAHDPAQDQYQQDLAAYTKQVDQLQRETYANAIRDRLKLVSAMRTRPSNDLRGEERQTVFGQLIGRLSLGNDPHLDAELVQQIFDLDEMLYFVAPDYWRPRTAIPDPHPIPHPGQDSVGKYPVPGPSWEPDQTAPLAGQTVTSWYSQTDRTKGLDAQGHPADEWRVDYLITEETAPAPMGSSLGWLIQLDGDERRNEFLNAAWAKAVLPVRPGRELDALQWLSDHDVEGEAALGLPYPFQAGDPPEWQGLTVGEVLRRVATGLQHANSDVANILAAEEVFETGFDPLAGGFRPAAPYQIFDQWVEVLPTDQVAAVEVHYDPKTGQQL
ncbi:hypothetical protein AB0L00_22125 [Actinoallomurus sp. NPDC052308]|uniref:hypothetical protein n=1 Tax=Actinoallomurus sp. NPDC052308 TaxID=3155530 RepID=UPI003446EF2E